MVVVVVVIDVVAVVVVAAVAVVVDDVAAFSSVQNLFTCEKTRRRLMEKCKFVSATQKVALEVRRRPGRLFEGTFRLTQK